MKSNSKSTTKILKTEIMKLQFHSSYLREENYCDTTIKLKEIQYDEDPNQNYYDISYKHKLSNKNLTTQQAHPFYKNMEDKSGEIIKKNSLTEKLVEYLLMDFEELQKHSGKTPAETYKKRIMESISLLWD
jgi:hypothetical protein